MTIMWMLLALALALGATSRKISLDDNHHHHSHHHHHYHQEDNFGPFTDSFVHFLNENMNRFKYALDAFATYGQTGTFGGKHSEQHDSALNYGAPDGSNSGWNRQLAYFKSRGYSFAEMYGLTYGDRTLAHSFMRSINCNDLLGHRKFAEAILEYTGSYELNVVAHSMGVTYARALIQGGKHYLNGQECDVGESLAERIETLIAISSANYGMCLCEMHSHFPACNESVGYFPGKCSNDNSCQLGDNCNEYAEGYSTVLRRLNDQGKDANFVFSLWSSGDQIIGTGGNMVHGRQTSLVPHSDMNIHFSGLTHFEMKTETVSQQYYLLKHHTLPRSMYNNSAEQF